MGQLELYGLKPSYGEIMVTATKRHQEPQHIIGNLLNAEISESLGHSTKYQMTIAELPMAKEHD